MDEITRNIISVIKDTVTILIENFADDEGKSGEAGEVSGLGSLLLNLLDEVAVRVGTYDARTTEDGTSLEETLTSFYMKVASYNDEKNQNKMSLRHLQIHSKSLKTVLDQDWNASLPNSPGAPASIALSPEKKKEKVLTVFEKFTPLKNQKVTKECPFCGQFFGIRSLKNHIRQKHKEDAATSERGEKEKNPKDDDSDQEDGVNMLGTCRMPDKKDKTLICGRRFPSDGIKRHLRDYHSYDCPNKPLRGFTSDDGGLSYTPIFLRKAEPDPEFDVMIQALDSPIDDKEDEAHEETPTMVLEVGPSSSSRPRQKRLFSSDDEVETVDKSADVDMSLEEQDDNEDEAHEETPTIVLEVGPSSSRPTMKRLFSSDDAVETVDKLADVDMSLAITSDDSNPNKEAEDNKKINRSTEVDMSFEEEMTKQCLEKIDQNTNEPNLTDISLTEPLDVSNTPHDVVDNFCQDYDRRVGLLVSFVADGSATIVDMNQDGDSDYEDGDSPDYSHNRVTRKSERHNNRIHLSTSNLKERAGNKDFIAKFKDFMLNRGLSQAKNERSAHKCFGHIFGYHDSLLEYESKQDEEFFLDRIIAFKSDDFLALKYPLKWIKSTCINDPSRAVEKLKAHKFLRDFQKTSADETDFGGSTEDILKRNLILDGIERISREISSKGLFAEYRKLIGIETVEKRQAKLTINPSEAHNLATAVATWNQSEESKERELHFLKVYEDMMSGNIKPRPFTSFGHYVRFLLAIADKSRPGSYHLLNSDIATCKRLWWPEGYTGFGDLPSGWDENVPPYPGAAPSSWSITVSGKTLKMLKYTLVFLHFRQ